MLLAQGSSPWKRIRPHALHVCWHVSVCRPHSDMHSQVSRGERLRGDVHQPLQATHSGACVCDWQGSRTFSRAAHCCVFSRVRMHVEPLPACVKECSSLTVCRSTAMLPRIMCSYVVRLRSQAFFTEQLGMPLSMEPNFEDYSCEMVFGRIPPPPEEDPAYKQVGSRDRWPGGITWAVTKLCSCL